MKTVKLASPLSDAPGGRNYSRAIRVVGPDWQPVAPSYYRDKGYQRDRGNVWRTAPVGSIVFHEWSHSGLAAWSGDHEEISIVLDDGTLRQLTEIEALPYWRAFEARFGSRELSACPMPETASERRLRQFEARFGMRLGRYVAIVPLSELPAERHYDWTEGRKLDHEYSWTSYDNVSHMEKDGWRIAVVSYSRQPFRANKFTLAARVTA